MTDSRVETPLLPERRKRVSELLCEASDMCVALGRLLRDGNVMECQTDAEDFQRALDARLAKSITIIFSHDDETIED